LSRQIQKKRREKGHKIGTEREERKMGIKKEM